MTPTRLRRGRAGKLATGEPVAIFPYDQTPYITENIEVTLPDGSLWCTHAMNVVEVDYPGRTVSYTVGLNYDWMLRYSIGDGRFEVEDDPENPHPAPGYIREWQEARER